MKTAALILGIIGGVVGMIVGVFAVGWLELTDWFNAEVRDVIEPAADATRWRIVGLFAPILAIVGGAITGSRPVIGAVLMLVSAAGMYWGFGFGFATMFPIAMCAVGGLLGLLAIGSRSE